MDYLIFSDESGNWNEGNYYLRSWIRMSPDNYEMLRKDIVFLKHETGIKELKWKSIKNNIRKTENTIISICNIDFIVFITISIPSHFQDQLKENKYTILRTLQSIKPGQSTGGEQVRETIKSKILSAAKHAIFYSVYEKQHIENSRRALVTGIPDESCQFVVDTPQCLDKDWTKIAKECGIININIEKKSENVPGIELADLVTGCIHEYLEGDEKAKEFYRKYIENKMLNMCSRAFPNPNLIFFKDFTSDEKKRANIFR
jgi:hypothetical protein